MVAEQRASRPGATTVGQQEPGPPPQRLNAAWGAARGTCGSCALRVPQSYEWSLSPQMKKAKQIKNVFPSLSSPVPVLSQTKCECCPQY